MDLNDFLNQPEPTPDQVRAAQIDELRAKLQRVNRTYSPTQAGALTCHVQAVRLMDSVQNESEQ